MSLIANISNISRGSVHDGGGLRTVVYFKGCGLRCSWCHNPETLSAKSDILYISRKCICCGDCIRECPEHHKIGRDKMLFDREGCIKCGKCADVCPSGALVRCGEKMTVSQVFEQLLKDRHYYEQSGGGVTLSGGECLLQADFAAELLKKCKEENIHTAIESAFFVPFENVQKVIPFADLVFADLKIPDTDKHKKYTGQGNELIIENIRKISDSAKNIIIRIPLIPGVNDSVGDMKAFGRIINTFGVGICGVELLKYNYLAESKYRIAGMHYESFGTESQTAEKINELCDILQKELNEKCRVVWNE